MDLQLAGKRALITGSSSGIGAGIAEMLAQEGCAVVVHGRNAERASAVAAKIGAAGVAIGDLSTNEGAEAVVEVAGDVDILVNNAGGSGGDSATPWLEVDEAAWERLYQSNTIAVARLVRRLLPAMKAKGWGRIINIGSGVAHQPQPNGPHYAAAKSALHNLTVSLARELGDCGVTANTVSPGLFMTPNAQKVVSNMRQTLGWGDISQDEAERRYVKEVVKIPVGRVGRNPDMGYAVCMLASPAAGYITGANLNVNGGVVMTV